MKSPAERPGQAAGRLNCVTCSQISAVACQQSNPLEFHLKHECAAFRPANHHFICSLFAFADTSSVTVGAGRHLSRMLSSSSAASRGRAFLTCWCAAHLHSQDTLLQGLPASHFFMSVAAERWLFFLFLLINPGDSDWTLGKPSWSPSCCGGIRSVCAAPLWPPWAPHRSAAMQEVTTQPWGQDLQSQRRCEAIHHLVLQM